ncbi:subgroup iiii aminotransferase [Anaeramoeba ignava]|uniref:Branched-chain-amino-acid aminotransferase n=1 Tax=Anaeramoeba ignava TaxID=1746090 RepID=A0A9Q0LFL5_ANAIG|nr:subgroup iiii aminotransferase [Anaeramoeba ignava]|eukprot:Anaeramoba_ignava/a217930_459.p1 GENE.a217930_459~~a217930_459.p1  ORF type:complete len:401 (-),score=142.40 a217930_459:114-1274(-)
MEKNSEIYPFLEKGEFPDIDSTKLKIELTKNPKKKPEPDAMKFGINFTDHMLEVDWIKDQGFSAPRILPYHNFQMDPATMVLHYSVEGFEGMKAYKDKNKNVRLFRPEQNMKRFLNTAKRLALPDFNPDELLKCLEKLVLIDADWIPEKEDFSLYIRPTIIGTTPALGLRTPTSMKIYVILSPVGPYFSAFKPLKLWAEDEYCRAWVGGTGNAKLGGNYGPTLLPGMKALEKGCEQILWLYGPEKKITEVGAMNLFGFWKNKDGEDELITASLDDGLILPGITRDSILTLARGWGEFKVSEKDWNIEELMEAVKENRMYEMFGAGTAAIVSPINVINFHGQEYKIPLDPDDPNSGAGKITKRIKKEIIGIQYGEIEHPWSVILKDK